MSDPTEQQQKNRRSRWRVPRGYAADQLIDRELERAKREGVLKGWELTPDGGLVIVISSNDNGAAGPVTELPDELATARARRDARQHQGTGVPHKTTG